MQIPEDGNIKYTMHWEYAPLPPNSFPEQLNVFRTALFTKGLIGTYPDGIGYGNVSTRMGNTTAFIISGTQTGKLAELTDQEYCAVNQFDIHKNLLYCSGPVKASSEALTHAAIYNADADIHCVLHIHHHQLWKALMQTVTTVEASISYGTPALAEKVAHLIQKDIVLQQNKIFVTAGHQDGIFVFGETVEEAYLILMRYYNQFVT